MELNSVKTFSGGSDFNNQLFLKSWFVLAEEPPDAEKTQEISSKNTSTKFLGSKSKNDQNRPESERGACNLPFDASVNSF